MSDLPNRNSDVFQGSASTRQTLGRYIQSMPTETIAQLSTPEPEVARVMERNILEMLGALPNEHFGVSITTNRTHLGRLLASAMMNGYFLHNAYQRMSFEKFLQGAQAGSRQSEDEES